jgi:hypothetical protein
VLEVYRRAVAEYGVPKEMLSDQGRQYASSDLLISPGRSCYSMKIE